MATSIPFLKALLPNSNIQAALKTIRTTEGTRSADGYGYMFGSNPRNDIRFTDFSKHPNIVQVHNNIRSTAAGAYQILYRTYQTLCDTYGFDGSFTPEQQDLMCLALFDGAGVLLAISKGGILQEQVLKKLSGIWASLPYAPYGQPTHTVAQVREIYMNEGGSVGVAA